MEGVGEGIAPLVYVYVRLLRKFADCIDGVDLSNRRVGQVFELSYRSAILLIAEGWAELVERRKMPRSYARV
jgi:hypothetical protein